MVPAGQRMLTAGGAGGGLRPAVHAPRPKSSAKISGARTGRTLDARALATLDRRHPYDQARLLETGSVSADRTAKPTEATEATEATVA